MPNTVSGRSISPKSVCCAALFRRYSGAIQALFRHKLKVPESAQGRRQAPYTAMARFSAR
eukprot:8963010-Alexandrium_andersonii.AAC.1